jgi:glycosyltransferase involved in cell wall biosynthesis
VRFVGVQPPAVIAALHAGADVFVWPAIAEPIGLAMLEAQACGLPVVAGRRPGSEAIVVDDDTGCLVPPGDDAAFAAAVAALLDDATRRRRLGARAAQRAAQHHDVSSATRALDALFATVLAARARRPW